MHDGENTQPTNSVKTLFVQHREDSKSELFCNSRRKCKITRVLSQIHLLALQVSMYSETQVRFLLLHNLLNILKKLLTVHSVRINLEKRFLMYHMSPVYHAASKNRGQAFDGNSRYSLADWK